MRTACGKRRSDAEFVALFFILLLSCSSLCEISLVETAAAGRIWSIGGGDSIQQTINSADEGDTILVGPGVYYEHLVVNKSLTIIGQDQRSTIIDGGNWIAVAIDANSVTLMNFTIQRGMIGIMLKAGAEGNTLLENMILFNSYYGIYGDRCGRNTIANNNVSFNGEYGIFLYGSKPCVLDSNVILSNGADGMFMRYLSNSTLKGNFVSENGGCGIYIYSDEDPERPSGLSRINVIRDNYIVNNSCGIRIRHLETNVTIAENEIYNNFVGYNTFGLNVSGSNGNSFYNNNFVGNSKQLSIYNSFNNTWNDGYCAGGNYWSDWNGSDLCWGPNQNEVGSDGIIDIPYLLSTTSTELDSYPFMHENGWRTFPQIDIVSPGDEISRSDSVPLVMNTNKPVQLTYCLDSQTNRTVAEKVILEELSIGMHSLTVYASDYFGIEVSSQVAFAVTFFEDLDLDGVVDIIDVSAVAYSFGSNYGSERWNPDADFNKDDRIDIIDVSRVAMKFAQTIWELHNA